MGVLVGSLAGRSGSVGEVWLLEGGGAQSPPREGGSTPIRAAWIVLICTMMTIFDGFDEMALPLAAPRLAGEWKMDAQTLGILFGLSFAGMALGSLLIAPLADRFGRRPIIIAGLLCIVLSMFLGSTAWHTTTLALSRLMTGLGSGALTPALYASAAAFASDKRRALVLGTISTGLPIGATVGGLIAIPLLEHFGWRSIFVTAGCLSCASLLSVWRFMIEAPDFATLPRSRESLSQQQGRQQDLGFLRRTILISAVSFCIQVSAFFVLQWMPKVLSDAGLASRDAIAVAVIMNTGGVVGALTFGFGARPVNIHRLTAVCMVFAGVLIALLPHLSHLLLWAAAFTCGFAMFAVGVGLFTLTTISYPAQTRVTGLGISTGVGRLGAVLGPVAAGFLIAAGANRATYFAALSLPILLASAAVLYLRGWERHKWSLH